MIYAEGVSGSRMLGYVVPKKCDVESDGGLDI